MDNQGKRDKTSKGIISGRMTTSYKKVEVRLSFISFKDSGCQIIYCPALDLSGYGKTKEEAKSSFEIVLEEFLKYTIHKGTLVKDLEALGWKRSGSKAKGIMTPPEISSLLDTNDDFREIFDNHQFTKSDANVPMPAFC